MTAIILAFVLFFIGATFLVAQTVLFMAEAKEREVYVKRDRAFVKARNIDFSDSQINLEIRRVRRKMQEKRVSRMQVTNRHLHPMFA